tara:strand:- start:1132 stop:2118 length:987 start_codon:yes stop_codon:yes gene_type:complete
MSKKILLVGCGQLGSRHLQAIVRLPDVSDVFVVDVNKASLDLGQSRLQELPDRNPDIKVQWSTQFNKEFSGGDICIVSTQAAGRSELIKKIAEELHYKNFLIEKVVTQSIQDYQELMRFSGEKNLPIWVNCKSRAYQLHRYIKSQLNPDNPIVFSTVGGNHGLGCNGVHAADLFVFHDGARKIHSLSSHIDPILHPSKRGEKIFDLTGTLTGYSDKGSIFSLSFASGHDSPPHISIVNSKSRFIVDHLCRFAYESHADKNWEWKRIIFDEDILVSSMSCIFINDILTKGCCSLPTLEECLPAHEFILSTLSPHFQSLSDQFYDYCPIT